MKNFFLLLVFTFSFIKTVQSQISCPDLVSIPIDTFSFCVGGGDLIMANLPLSGTSLKWYHNNQEIPGVNISTFMPELDGWYKIIAEKDTCVGQDSAFVEMVSIPMINAGPDYDLCSEGKVFLTGSKQTEVNISWSSNVSGTFTSTSNLISTFTPDIYGQDFEIFMTSSPKGNCEPLTDIIKVKYHSISPISVFIGNDTVIHCKEEFSLNPIVNSILLNPKLEYIWNPYVSNIKDNFVYFLNSRRNSVEEVFLLVKETRSNCSARDTIILNFTFNQIITDIEPGNKLYDYFNQEYTQVCAGVPVQLNLMVESQKRIVSVDWKKRNGYFENDPENSFNPVFIPLTGTSSYLSSAVSYKVTDEDGCTNGRYFSDRDSLEMVHEVAFCTNNGLLKGKAFVDDNQNGIFDAGELPVISRLVGSGKYLGVTDSLGNYEIVVPEGYYKIDIQKEDFEAFVHPLTGFYDGYISDDTINDLDFSIIVPEVNDLSVSLSSRAFRPGFSGTIYASVSNDGNTSLPSYLEIIPDSRLIIDSVSSGGIPENGKIAWSLEEMEPGEGTTRLIHFTLPSTTLLGTNLIHTAELTNSDNTPENNIDILYSTVTGSFDPNDKLVNFPTLQGTVIASTDPFDYTIRFQNTGTDTAFTVVIKDTIAPELNLFSFKTLSASHPYTVSIDSNRVISWRFNNILLPDSNTNEPLSHGFVKFRIHQQDNQVGTVIKNKAAIYFDYNFPVITNEVETVINTEIIQGKLESEAALLQVFPNPATDIMQILGYDAYDRIEIVDFAGRIIKSYPRQSSYNLYQIPSGVYFVKVIGSESVQQQKLIIK